MHWSWRRTQRVLKIMAAIMIVAVPAAHVSQARLAVHEAVSPLHRAAPSQGRTVAMPDDPDRLKALVLLKRQENDRLRARMAAMEDRLAQIQSELQRLGQYRQLAEVLKLPSTRGVAARILRRGTNWDHGTLIIDRGRADGLEVGCGVLAGPAVMGVVIEVGEVNSRVALLTHEGVHVAARIVETRQIGTLSGREERAFLDDVGVERPTRERPVPEAGQMVVTAGLNGVFPPGVLIGSLAEIEQRPESLFYDIRVQPAARFDEIETVVVLRLEHVAVDAPMPEAPPSVPVWQ